MSAILMIIKQFLDVIKKTRLIEASLINPMNGKMYENKSNLSS